MARSDAAVLFVHGIGRQRPRQTLDTFALSLVDFLERTVGAPAGRGGILRPVDEECRGTTSIRRYHLGGGHAAGRGGPVKTLALVETHWANSFEPPGIFSWMAWLLQSADVVCVHHLAASYRDRLSMGLVVLRRALRDGDLRSLLSALAVVVITIAALNVGVVTRYVALVVVGTVTLAMVPLTLLGPVRGGLRWVGDFVGDSYAVLRVPQERARIEAQLADAVQECLDMTAPGGRVTVVAHSQGAMLSHRVLAARRFGPRVSLIGLGSGLAPLHSLGQPVKGNRTALALGSAISFELATALCLATTLVSVLRLTGPVGERVLAVLAGLSPRLWDLAATKIAPLRILAAPGPQFPLAAALLILAIALVVLTLWLIRGAGLDLLTDRWQTALALPAGSVRAWTEFSSPLDPVSSGPILAGVAGRCVPVINGWNLLTEHTGYHKHPAFLIHLALEIEDALDLQGGLIPLAARDRLVSSVRRTERLRRLALQAQLSLLNLAALASMLALALGSASLMDALFPALTA